MGRNRKKHEQKKKQQAEENPDIKINIPGGMVHPERWLHDEIELESREKALSGNTMVHGEVVSTPVRKLLECGAITHDEADAANRFQHDHAAAFSSYRSSLCSIAVDGSEKGDFTKQVDAIQRFNGAKSWLRPTMSKIAEAAILGTVHNHPVTYSFTNLGSDFLPKGSSQEHIPAGKGILALVIRELYCFYASLNERGGKRRKESSSKLMS